MKRLYRYTVEHGFTPIFVLLGVVIAASVALSVWQGVSETLSGIKRGNSLPTAAGQVIEVTKIDKTILQQSVYKGPFLLTILRSDGSFSYAVVVSGDLADDKFSGDVQVRYPNGDFGNITDTGSAMDLYFTKKGS